jgi:hypothetical protein
MAEVSMLRGMFPMLDAEVIESVLLAEHRDVALAM